MTSQPNIKSRLGGNRAIGKAMVTAVAIAVIWLMLPMVANAESPVTGELVDGPTEIQLMPEIVGDAGIDHAFSIEPGRVVPDPDHNYNLDLLRLKVGEFSDALHRWHSDDRLFFDLVVELGIPLYSGDQTKFSVDTLLVTRSESRPMVTHQFDFFARTVREEIEISRVVDDQTPSDPVMVNFLHLNF